jgi:hypothetical protein
MEHTLCHERSGLNRQSGGFRIAEFAIKEEGRFGNFCHTEKVVLSVDRVGLNP